MGLNGIRNPAKLRKIARLIGEPCLYACARYFADQRDVLAFGASGSTWVVRLDRDTCEPYTEEGRHLEPFVGVDGVMTGVRSVPNPS